MRAQALIFRWSVPTLMTASQDKAPRIGVPEGQSPRLASEEVIAQEIDVQIAPAFDERPRNSTQAMAYLRPGPK